MVKHGAVVGEVGRGSLKDSTKRMIGHERNYWGCLHRSSAIHKTVISDLPCSCCSFSTRNGISSTRKSCELQFSMRKRTDFLHGYFGSSADAIKVQSFCWFGESSSGRVIIHGLYRKDVPIFGRKGSNSNSINRVMLKKVNSTIPRSSGSSNSNGSEDDSSNKAKGKTPFGYSRKDVLLIGLGVTGAGYGLKSGLELAGVDPLQAGNVVQLVLVLGLTIGWISTYIFRVSNKEMTYAQQLRNYESQVMEKRLEGLTEAELEALLEQVEEEKRRLGEVK